MCPKTHSLALEECSTQKNKSFWTWELQQYHPIGMYIKGPNYVLLLFFWKERETFTLAFKKTIITFPFSAQETTYTEVTDALCIWIVCFYLGKIN